MSGIVPKSKTKGVDILGGFSSVKGVLQNYIIRSDLGSYMCTSNMHREESIHIHSLHPSCKDGDHYLCDDKRFYIIKGDSYRTVTDLTKDSHSAVYDLHPKCRGGDHYLYTGKIFYIIFQSRGKFRKTSDLYTDKDGKDENDLPSDIKDGLYYWGIEDGYICVLKQTDQWGLQIHRSSSFKNDAKLFSVHPDVVNFLPGGLAVTQGRPFKRWDLIKTIDNDSDISIIWEKKVTQKVGYNKSKSSSIEHNWKVSANVTAQMGKLTQSLFQYQFSLSTEYGGLLLNTESENWEEATEVQESVNFTLQPKTKMFMWQYKLGFGKEDFLFCRDLGFTKDPNPPADIPFPAAQ